MEKKDNKISKDEKLQSNYGDFEVTEDCEGTFVDNRKIQAEVDEIAELLSDITDAELLEYKNKLVAETDEYYKANHDAALPDDFWSNYIQKLKQERQERDRMRFEKVEKKRKIMGKIENRKGEEWRGKGYIDEEGYMSWIKHFVEHDNSDPDIVNTPSGGFVYYSSEFRTRWYPFNLKYILMKVVIRGRMNDGGYEVGFKLLPNLPEEIVKDFEEWRRMKAFDDAEAERIEKTVGADLKNAELPERQRKDIIRNFIKWY
jgi:hypothetical protein